MAHETYATRFGLRPIAYGRRGMVAAANPLATLAGLRMFAAGGNAVDAAVAAAAALTVVEPYMSGVAGSGCLLLTPPNGTPMALMFRGCAPAAAELGRFDGRHPDRGYTAPSVPGNLAGWSRVLADYGTMSLAQVLDPAIEYAEQGVPFTVFDHAIFTESAGRLTPEGVENYIPDGRIPDVGAVFDQRHLAATLRSIASQGIGYLYDGPLGHQIDKLMREHGGLITISDLRAYPDRVRWVSPLQTVYRGVTVCVPPPPTSAVQLLETLNVLSDFDMTSGPHLGPDYVMLIAEAARAARKDTDRHIADPDYASVPVQHLLSSHHTGALREEVKRKMAGPNPPPSRVPSSGAVPASTTHLAAVDGNGLAVNITQTLGHAFGSGVVVPGTGVCLNNGLHWFSYVEGHLNVIAPGKVSEGPVAPVHLFRNGDFWGAAGTPGSYGILVTTVQFLVNLIDYSLNLQDAIAAPRFRWADEVGDPLPPQKLRMESRIPQATRETLATRGYDIEVLGPWTMRVGGVQGVLRDTRTGWLSGGADPRRNGYAIGW
jgi:gamma-glutamyltranspeptidase/glutathione hydrolase